jgi:dTDP-4-dehydrorhamnose 3,5-epimerase
VVWAGAGLPATFLLENHITSRQWVLRGIHRQMSAPQGKLVRCLIGRVFDVAVDLRPESTRFGRWVGRELTGQGGDALWVPPGFGHGMLALTEGAVISIQATAPAVPGDEATLSWDDPEVGILWPLSRSGRPILSARDRSGDCLASFRQPIRPSQS